jgi:hypothetical protein
LLDLGLDRRHGLDRAAPRADDADALSGQLDVVAPLGGVEGGTGERVEAGKARRLRHAELPAGGQQDIRLEAPGAGRQLPLGRLLVPGRRLDRGVGEDPLGDAVLVGEALEVGLDLGLRRKATRPARVRLEGELVEVGGDVAGRTRVGVVMPDAADPVGLLEHGHVGVAGALQHDRRADPRKARADDRDRAAGGRAVFPFSEHFVRRPHRKP